MSGESQSAEAGFNTQAVERLTGVPADTFRAWERRYGVPSPRRLPGGRRVYSSRDVEVVRWLRQQTEAGFTVSMAVAQLQQQGGLPPAPISPSLAPAELTRSVVEAALRFDTAGVETALSQAMASHPLEVVCLEVVKPALVELGELWHRGEVTPATEHFATGLVRRRLEQLAAVLDGGPSRPLVVVGAGPGELHDVGALLFSVLLRRHGVRVVFLGQNVPLEGAVDVSRRLEPDMVCLSAATPDAAAQVATTARALAALPAPAPRVVFGGQAFDASPPLRERVPGTYLGPDAAEAARRAAAMLTGR
jgi:MerR family transcriptional regulator, light-induced transcriptional regulator